MKQLGSAVKQQDEDVDEGTQPRYVPCIDAENSAFDAELSCSNHCRITPENFEAIMDRARKRGNMGLED